MRQGSLIVLAWFVVGSVAGAQQVLPWTTQEVYSGSAMDHGQWIDVVIEPVTEHPVACAMVHTEVPSLTEYFEWYRYLGGAGWDGDWRAYGTGVVSGERCGEHSSMDAYADGASWILGFAFRDRTHGTLSYLENSGTGSATGTVTRQGILSSTLTGYGYYTSLRFDAGGTPHVVSYASSLIGDDSLIYSQYVGSGGNCGVDAVAGQWQCETITSGPVRGKYAALALDGVGLPRIMFSDNSSSTGELWFAERRPGTGNCGEWSAAGNWQCSLVESYPSRELVETAVHYDGGVLHVVFLEVAGDQATLRYAKATDSAAQKAAGWGFATITAYGGYTAGGRSVDITTDGDGLPVILYRQSQVDQVRIARPVEAGFLPGNCGPSLTWRCDVIDTGLTADAVGEWVAIACDDQGRPFAGFSRYDSGVGRRLLYVAYPWLFVDGFEGGSTDWWTSSTAAP